MGTHVNLKIEHMVNGTNEKMESSLLSTITPNLTNKNPNSPRHQKLKGNSHNKVSKIPSFLMTNYKNYISQKKKQTQEIVCWLPRSKDETKMS